MHGAMMMLAVLSVASVSLAAAVTIDGKPGGSLEALRDRARHERTSATQPVTIRLTGGTIATTQPLVLGPEDSYTTWETAPGMTSILSGGRRIEGWRTASFNGRDCW